MLIPHNPVIEYPDYKNFINFLDNSYKLKIKNINPYEYFRLEVSEGVEGLDRNKYVNSFFNGNHNPLPTFRDLDDEFQSHLSFENFTSHDEVNNISLWSMACLKNLSFDTEIRLGKELEILQTDNPRDGRLDVVAFGNNELLVLESKVDVTSLLNEGRFSYQVPSYRNEGLRDVEQYINSRSNNDNFNFSILLLVGGKETDLYPPDHPDCTTGKVGNISKIFYDQLIKYDIKFITANALWALSTTVEEIGKKLFWHDVLPKIYREDGVLGLLSGGKVVLENNKLIVKPLELE